MSEKKWYKLDNIGILYASTANHNIPNVFRYSVLISDNIDEDILQEALVKTLELFPNFNVNLKLGFFWHYLQETNKIPKVSIENIPVCANLYKDEDDHLFRVSYYKNKINLEMSHILSDGRGSMEFFKILVSNYIKIKYKLSNINLTTNSSSLDKTEDSYSKYYEKKGYNPKKKIKVYNYRGKKMRKQTLYMDCHLSTSACLKETHKYNTTLTAYLVAVLIYSFRNELSINDLKKTIKIEIPVDLRNYYHSNSSKNFFGLAHIFYKFNSLDEKFSDIVKNVDKQFKENINIENLSSRANKMVSFEKNLFCKCVPIALKNLVISIVYKNAFKMSTTCLSNVGKFEFDSKIAKYIKSIVVLTSTDKFQFTIGSCGDDLSIGISSRYRYNNIIRNFCLFFKENNLDIKINVSEVN